jgi:hypothetical protein
MFSQTRRVHDFQGTDHEYIAYLIIDPYIDDYPRYFDNYRNRRMPLPYFLNAKAVRATTVHQSQGTPRRLVALQKANTL